MRIEDLEDYLVIERQFDEPVKCVTADPHYNRVIVITETKVYTLDGNGDTIQEDRLQ